MRLRVVRRLMELPVQIEDASMQPGREMEQGPSMLPLGAYPK
jgi:hypothetical protein